MDLKEIKQIIDLMKRSELTEFSVEEANFKLRIRRDGAVPVPGPAASTAPQALPPAPAAAGSPPSAEEAGIAYIKSPMVGTFYSSSSPDSQPFVEINQRIDEGTIVCIIEAMKIMNEIQSEVKGVIVETLVENGQPVEFGQRIFRVKTN